MKSPTEGCDVVGSDSRRAQLLEEGGVVGDVRLALGAVAAEHDVERNDPDAVLAHELRREVGGGVRDYGYGGIRAAAYP